MTDYRTTELNGTYTILLKHGIPFMNVIWEDNTSETFLLLFNDLICFLYTSSDINPYLWGGAGGFNRGEAILHSPTGIRASSFLIENGRQYLPEHINTKLEEAWVEGVKGQGIHEKLFIDPPFGCTALHISIGYVSYNKPYLYEENSRPKKLNISVSGKFSFDIELIDTPNYQTINLPQAVEENDILIIEILDVFPGTKHEDTCINSILYDIMPIPILIPIIKPETDVHEPEITDEDNKKTEDNIVNNHKKSKLWYIFLLVIPLTIFLGIRLIIWRKNV
jgi:hypothetical protein